MARKLFQVTSRTPTQKKDWFLETLACGCSSFVRLHWTLVTRATVKPNRRWATGLTNDPVAGLKPYARACPSHQGIGKSDRERQVEFYRAMARLLRDRASERGIPLHG